MFKFFPNFQNFPQFRSSSARSLFWMGTTSMPGTKALMYVPTCCVNRLARSITITLRLNLFTLQLFCTNKYQIRDQPPRLSRNTLFVRVEKAVLLYNPPPAFSTKISLFLRNRGRWFQISTSFASQTSSFGDIHISSNKSDIDFPILRPFLHYYSKNCMF